MYYNGFVFVFVWCPCTAVNVSVQHNGGFLPGIILLTQCHNHRGEPFTCHEEVLFLQPMIPPKRFDIFFPLTEGCSEGLDAFRFFFKQSRRSRRVLNFLLNNVRSTLYGKRPYM